MTEEEINAYKKVRNAYMREWRKRNKDKIKEQNKKYRETHKEQIKETHRKWREKNRNRTNEKAREKYKENPQAFKERNDRYIASHKEYVRERKHNYDIKNREKRAAYERNKRHSDPIYRFRGSSLNLIRQYTKGKGYKGDKTTYEILGCDFDYFLKHIQSLFQDGMTLENYGEWNIDHIIPISSAKTDEDLERLNHYTNLQPLWASDNFKKSKKIKDTQ